MKSIISLSSAVATRQLPLHPVADGIIHRFSTNGKAGDQAGWYWYNGSVGTVGDWRTGESVIFVDQLRSRPADRAEQLNQARQALKASAERHASEREKKQYWAAVRAYRLWNEAANPDPGHEYLQRKQIKPVGIKQLDRNLIIPLTDEQNFLISMQFISPGGEKAFLKGGRVRGCFFYLPGDPKRVGVAEGYSTGAVLHQLTGASLFCSMSCHNLTATARAARKLYPNSHLTIYADADDAGLAAAQKAAQASFADSLKVPDFAGHDLDGRPTDWADLYSLLKERTRSEGCGQKDRR